MASTEGEADDHDGISRWDLDQLAVPTHSNCLPPNANFHLALSRHTMLSANLNSRFNRTSPAQGRARWAGSHSDDDHTYQTIPLPLQTTLVIIYTAACRSLRLSKVYHSPPSAAGRGGVRSACSTSSHHGTPRNEAVKAGGEPNRRGPSRQEEYAAAPMMGRRQLFLQGEWLPYRYAQ